jgi:pimeloyl-ACP methyl ester carboxylesterase
VRQPSWSIIVKATARSGAGGAWKWLQLRYRASERNKLHYVRGGTGSAVILLHGFPEDWYAYHRVMPLLAKQFTVVAVDLRGLGGSAVTTDGYDAVNMAEDIHQLAKRLHLGSCLHCRSR